MKLHLVGIFCVTILASCSRPLPTVAVIIPTAINTIQADNFYSPTASATVTFTSSFTPSPTATPSLTDTNTPSPSPTSTPTPKPTSIPPTPAPTATIRPEAPLLPGAPIVPFDKGTFINTLAIAQQKYYEKLFFFRYVNGAGYQNCNTYWQYIAEVKGYPGFSDVPEAWFNLYYEYRTLINQSASATALFDAACVDGNVLLDKNGIDPMAQAIDNIQARLAQMVIEAQTLP